MRTRSTKLRFVTMCQMVSFTKWSRMLSNEGTRRITLPRFVRLSSFSRCISKSEIIDLTDGRYFFSVSPSGVLN